MQYACILIIYREQNLFVWNHIFWKNIPLTTNIVVYLNLFIGYYYGIIIRLTFEIFYVRKLFDWKRDFMENILLESY